MIDKYILHLKQELSSGNALEHSYRPALKNLMEDLDATILAVNEPMRSAHGAPDFIFLDKKNSNLIRGYAETKDVNVDLDNIEKSEQLKRYLGYSNLILTNYLEFRFFRNGEKYQTVVVARKSGAEIEVKEENFSTLQLELRAFLNGIPETITNAKRLSEIMGGKAARIRSNIVNYLQYENDKNDELNRIYKVMQELLVHDLTIEKFADMYAQTLVYGLFVARYYDKTPEDFTRQEARDLIPASNPFLQHFFDHIVGPSFDKRLNYIVEELCKVFSVSAVQEIIQKHYNLFGETVDKDPIIHFYEDFLREYDPELRKNMGAYYTPVPVVHFMLRAVDDTLKRVFDLQNGLADTSKVEQKYQIQGIKSKRSIHKVQVLDPAVGTATFLNESIKKIYEKFKGQEGSWDNYVELELLPRIYGFELMMAPYTIAHLKLAMTLKETGIDHFDRRLGVYLTNTLEQGVKTAHDLFSFGLAEAISEEARAANIIKNETPIMVVMGNPPYSGESFNKGEYAMKLVEKYKVEPGGEEKLKERNPKWLNDDYVKFIAFAEEMVQKTGEGIVAMITNHGYLDNPTFRGMRWHLVKTFDFIHVLDLHGNAKKNEKDLDGGKDENVFDIQQGVSIIVAIKHRKKKRKIAEVYRADIRGKRKKKFEFLLNNTIDTIDWEAIRLNPQSYLFLNKNERVESLYKSGVRLSDLFPISTVGIVTSRDKFVIDTDKNTLINRISDFVNNISSGIELSRYVKESPKFNFDRARALGFDESLIFPIQYRPFDQRFIYYRDYFIERSRKDVMQNFLIDDNYGLVLRRQFPSNPAYFYVTKYLSADGLIRSDNKGGESFFPLYIDHENKQSSLISHTNRTPNINISVLKLLLRNIGDYEWVEDHKDKSETDTDIVSPIDVLDYAYSILYSNSYRQKFQDFLKSDFPYILVPSNKDYFWKLVNLGRKLRKIHLLDNQQMSGFKTEFPITGDNMISKLEYKDGKVFINESQYFGNVPKNAWEFYIGSYLPAQKWLKDRKGNVLTFRDIDHYQKLIAALEETEKLMREIDEVVHE